MVKNNKKYPNLIILDVRNPPEYNLGHLYDAILIPYDELEEKIHEIEVYKNTEIIVYCKSGYRSQLASEILVEDGFIKVYNMHGGILAWIDADYPIWTTSHHITVDEITDRKFELLIEPLLLYYSPCLSCNEGCTTCNENQECPSQSESISITSTVLEQEEDYKKVLFTYESNGTTYEYIFSHTLLWNYSKITNNFNETAYFISTEIISENFYLQYYQLEYFIYHKNYNLTIHTHLDPLNSETYNRSFTYIKYTPVNDESIASMEFVKFNISVKLSQQYIILAEIAEEMAKIYKVSEDQNLKKLYFAYIEMEEGISSFSELVKEQLSEYDWQILESFAVLTDEIVPPNGGGTPPSPPEPSSGCIPSIFDCILDTIICGVALGSILACAIMSWDNFWLCVWALGSIAPDVICACISTCCCLGNDICCLANCYC